MLTAAQAIGQAQSQIGVSEVPPGSNCQPFGIWYGMPCEDWCAIFASWALYDHGAGETPIPITTPKGFSYCPDAVRWFKQRGAWESVGQPGDLILYDWDGDGVADHVEIVVSRSADASTYTTVGGNTGPASTNHGGMVAQQVRQAHFAVMGFGRPAYAATAPAPAPTPPALPASTPPETEEPVYFTAVDPKNGNVIHVDELGEVFIPFTTAGTQPTVDGYLGGLNNHPLWHAGLGQANGPVIGIWTEDDGLSTTRSAYGMTCKDAAGKFHPFVFSADGRYVKAS